MNENIKCKVLVMCLADPSNNPRPRRAIELCISMGFDVSVLGYPPSKPLEGVRFFSLTAPSMSLMQKIARKACGVATAVTPHEKGKIYWENLRFGMRNAREILGNEHFDILIIENLQLLPLAFEMSESSGFSRIVFDAREFYPLEYDGNFWFDLFEKRRRTSLCSHYLRRCDAVLTVSEGLRREYARMFDIDSIVYRSTPYYYEGQVTSTNHERIRMVYHGAANRDRKLENLIDVVAMLDDRFSLDMILVGNPRYQKELQRKAADNKRISFPQPVPFDNLISAIGKYDIGFFYYEPNNFNVTHCLPNKFFEYIQARLMIAIGPSPDMADLVQHYGCGVIAKDFSVEAMAKKLKALSAEDIDEAKINSDKAARELCFEKEREKLAAILKHLWNDRRMQRNRGKSFIEKEEKAHNFSML